MSLPLKHSLHGKMLLFLALPVMLIIAGMLSYSYLSSLEQAIAQAKLNLSQTADTIAARVNEETQLAVRTTQVMALAQQNGLFKNREASVELVRSVLKMNPSFVGASFGYEPNADNQDKAYINIPALKEGRFVNENGRFLPYWYRDFNDAEQLVLEPLVDMQTSLYYEGVRQQFLRDGNASTMITEPYVYEGRMLVEQSTPIIINGEFVGIATVDRALADITTFLQTIKRQSKIDVLLLSQQNKVIASTLHPSELITKAIIDTDYASLAKKLISQAQTRDVIAAHDPFDSEMFYFAKAQVNTGDWTVIVRRSEADIIGPIQAQFRPLLATAFASLLLVFLLFWHFINRTTKRINIAIDAVERLASGNLSIDVNKYMNKKDELGTMFKSFERLIKASKEIDQVCSAIAAGDFSKAVSQRSAHDSLSDSINLMSAKRHEAEQALLKQTIELQRTQKVLVEAEKMSSLGSLVSGVAHEVNTPLGVCVTATSHLREILIDTKNKVASGTLSKTQFSEFITEVDLSCDILLKNMQRAADLISSFKRVAVDQTSEELRNLHISSYFNEVLKSLHHTVKTIPVDITISATEPEPEVYSDPGALAQIFTNLVMNSIIHGFENGSQKGQISIHVEYSDNIYIHYKDNGGGMTNEVQKKVFDPFYTTNRGSGGSGLGMNVVYNLVVHRLKGQILVKQKESKGVYFFIQFPVSLPN